MDLRSLDNMKRILQLFLILFSFSPLFSQKVDSIYFNLYTDSLKKGQHNYINIDGKLSNGKWLPMTARDINFSCATAEFSGNELIIPEDFRPEKVTIRAVLKSNPQVIREITVWIKKKPDGPLPTQDDIMRDMQNKQKSRRN